MQKLYYSYKDIHRIVAGMAKKIQAASFSPQAMIAIGSGGFIPARILRTYLNIPIYTITTAYYDENHQPSHSPKKIQWLDDLSYTYLKDKSILLVDEIDDSRITLEYCLNHLHAQGLSNIGIAVIHEKRKPKKGIFPDTMPAYFSGEQVDDVWICYPWDILEIDK